MRSTHKKTDLNNDWRCQLHASKKKKPLSAADLSGGAHGADIISKGQQEISLEDIGAIVVDIVLNRGPGKAIVLVKDIVNA